MGKKKTEDHAGARAGAALLARRNASTLGRERVAADAGLAASTVARIELGYERHPRALVVGQILKALRYDADRPSQEERRFEARVLALLADLAS